MAELEAAIDGLGEVIPGLQTNNPIDVVEAARREILRLRIHRRLNDAARAVEMAFKLGVDP